MVTSYFPSGLSPSFFGTLQQTPPWNIMTSLSIVLSSNFMDTHSILNFSASNFPKDLALHRNGNGTGDSILRSNENNLSIPSASFSKVRLLPCVYFAFSLTRLLSPSVSFLVQESATAPDPGQYDLTISPVWLNLLRALCATS